jgi:hypothetical protein
MEQRALARAAFSVLAEAIVQTMPEIIVDGTWRGSGESNHRERSVSVKDMYRAMKHAMTRKKATPGRDDALNVHGHLTLEKGHRCRGRPETAKKE